MWIFVNPGTKLQQLFDKKTINVKIFPNIYTSLTFMV